MIPEPKMTHDSTIHLLLQLEDFDGTIWNITRGDGVISEALREYGYRVHATDTDNRGYGPEGVVFLESKYKAANIIAQPSYQYSRRFATHALELAQSKVVIGLHLYLHSGYMSFDYAFDGHLNPTRIYVIPDRKRIDKAGYNPKGGYAWYVWDQEQKLVDGETPPYPDVKVFDDDKNKYGWYIRAGVKNYD